MKTKSTSKKLLLTLLSFLLFAISFQVKAQVAEAPKFVKSVITQVAGESLSFDLTDLPEVATYAKSDGKVHIQINWQIGESCNSGQSFQSQQEITKGTETIYTNYRLSKSDNGKKIRINVSYINPQEGEVPAEYFILAQSNCTTIKIIEK